MTTQRDWKDVINDHGGPYAVSPMKLAMHITELELRITEQQERLNAISERLNRIVGPEFWGINLLDALDETILRLKTTIAKYDMAANLKSADWNPVSNRPNTNRQVLCRSGDRYEVGRYDPLMDLWFTSLIVPEYWRELE